MTKRYCNHKCMTDGDKSEKNSLLSNANLLFANDTRNDINCLRVILHLIIVLYDQIAHF